MSDKSRKKRERRTVSATTGWEEIGKWEQEKREGQILVQVTELILLRIEMTGLRSWNGNPGHSGHA